MYAAIRIRGEVAVKPKIKESLRHLNLDRANHLVILNDSAKGMLETAKDYITFGEIDKETLVKIIEKRGKASGDKKITAEFLEEKKIKSIEDIASAVEKGKDVSEFGIKKVFRLNPPSKGYERGGIKKTFKEGGVLGYRGKEINALIARMI